MLLENLEKLFLEILPFVSKNEQQNKNKIRLDVTKDLYLEIEKSSICIMVKNDISCVILPPILILPILYTDDLQKIMNKINMACTVALDIHSLPEI